MVKSGSKIKKKLLPKNSQRRTKKRSSFKGVNFSDKKFLASAAHDLKTPLTSLRNEIEISLSKDRQAEEYKKSLYQILSDTKIVCKRLKNIFDLTQVSATQKNYKTVDLTNLTTEVAEIIQNLALKKQIKFSNSLKMAVFTKGDKSRLAQALFVICSNAIKCTKEGGEMFLKLSVKKSLAKIRISSNNFLIPAKDFQFFFNYSPFSSTNKKNDQYLEMEIAQAIVKAHKGKFFLEGKNNRVTFTITLPRI